MRTRRCGGAAELGRGSAARAHEAWQRSSTGVSRMASTTVLRHHVAGETPEVTTVELFFDLVYVFAITQLSRSLHEHLTARGALETLVLFLAVWWAWNYTAWATNWVDPDHTVVRVLMVLLMLISLVMSAALPRAFGSRGLVFAL